MSLLGLLALFALGAETSLPLAPGLTAIRNIPSEYAHQAAAADATHFFAISSTKVAVHDRGTGKLLRVSEGPALHLNSGFVHEGKLYCAHSNYPKKPESSDIRVYDPSTNKLTVFHSFQNPPGSLVWCVVREGVWWCCFAHYGAKENAKTTLVRFDDATLTKGTHWTFPAKVVADWDNMSASGGLWDGDSNTLLVTHHHFKVLYRVKLPEKGTELKFVEALTSPFPGQGIASDTKTNHLIGIDRTAKAIIIAERQQPRPK